MGDSPRKTTEVEKQAQTAWLDVLRAAVRAQEIVPEAITVGGTAAALYAEHRLSTDADHTVATLRTKFDLILETLDQQPGWVLARPDRPVQILGSLDNVQVGFRQLRRTAPIETTLISTPVGQLKVPTLDEMICIKAFLCSQRNQTRDYLDFAALSQLLPASEVLQSLRKLDQRYVDVVSQVSLSVAERLTVCSPQDLAGVSLTDYKGLKAEWQDWDRVKGICSDFGRRFGESLVLDD